MTDPVWVRFSSAPSRMARAMPKSATFTWPGGGDEDVARLDVAVHDAVAVGEARARRPRRRRHLGRPAAGAAGLRLRRISDRLRPSTYSITM